MNIIQISKYERPGIYSEIYDNSVITGGLSNTLGVRSLVLLSSKKGKLFSPILVSNPTEAINNLGALDRNLESKGSYGHRTVEQLIKSNPVIAINLALVDDNLDKYEYKSFSTSTSNLNDIKRSDGISKFHNTTGFWNLETDAFLNVVDDNLGASGRILNFTNVGEKNLTVFIYKSNTANYNTTLLEWYGAVEKVPTYLYPTDYVSDYMVDVLVVAGDFTNYANLAVDKTWSKYFNTTGLRKESIDAFINERNLTVLKYYNTLSLIPYFNDENERNIFIESVINNDTDITGLYCAFDIDSLQTDEPNGLIDLIGNGILNNNLSSIDYLSYQEEIKENITYNETKLDRVGNVISIGATGYARPSNPDNSTRTALYSDFYVGGLSSDLTFASSSTTIDFTAIDSYAVINTNMFNLSDTSFTILPTNYTISSGSPTASQDFREVYVIDINGNLKTRPTNSDLVNGIVLGYVDFTINRNNNTPIITSATYTGVCVDNNGFIDLDVNTSGTDVTVTTNGTLLTYEFQNTSGTIQPTDFVRYRRLKYFNAFATSINGANKEKISILSGANVNASNGHIKLLNEVDINISVVSATNLNKSIIIDIPLTTPSVILQSGLILYKVDDEFLMGSDKVVTKKEIATSTEGVVGKFSDMYEDIFNGVINTSDYFYENILTDIGVISTVRFFSDNSISYIGLTTNIDFNTDDTIKFPTSTLNTGEFTIINPVANTTVLGGYYSFEVNELVNTETVSNVSTILSTNDSNKHYIKTFFEGDTLNVLFSDSSLSSISPTDNINAIIETNISNYKQTVEIETLVSPNTINVIGSRYTELKVGDFLEAEISNDFVGVPKKLTRILSKKTVPNNANLVQIVCDSTIKIYDFDGDLQTTRVTSMNDYIRTLKGVTLNGFRLRDASLPNGTDERLTEILNLVAKGTDLYNALTDKNTISFRYLVDSYGLGLTSNSKRQLVDICGARLDAFGFINMPSIKQFKKSDNPSFTDEKGQINYDFIANGGNPESNPAFLYSFANTDYSSFSAYFTPYVKQNDNGRPIDVPPAAYVATSYLKKFNTNIIGKTPWTVIAGVVDGLVNGIGGLETNFNNEAIKALNRMKANPIISKGNRGIAIETENTSQTAIKSALSYIHVVEVLIELEKELALMLEEYQWRYNTPEVRAEIKYRADLICDRYVAQSGLYEYFNKIDDENNTPDLIDNQLGLLETYVEPIKAMGVLVNQITAFKTGGIASSGFKTR